MKVAPRPKKKNIFLAQILTELERFENKENLWKFIIKILKKVNKYLRIDRVKIKPFFVWYGDIRLRFSQYSAHRFVIDVFNKGTVHIDFGPPPPYEYDPFPNCWQSVTASLSSGVCLSRILWYVLWWYIPINFYLTLNLHPTAKLYTMRIIWTMESRILGIQT